VSVRLILGRAYGETAPVQVFSETFYADADLTPGSRLPLPDDHEDRGLYVVEGSISVAGEAFESSRRPILQSDAGCSYLRVYFPGGRGIRHRF
jgi:redox-sensitive bicupin YhaK (pirin superfamily)